MTFKVSYIQRIILVIIDVKIAAFIVSGHSIEPSKCLYYRVSATETKLRSMRTFHNELIAIYVQQPSSEQF